MMKICTLLIYVILLYTGQSIGQQKVIFGQRHSILVKIPKNWLQFQNNQLPFVLKPNKTNISNETYIYVYGIDYKREPSLDRWVTGNNLHILDNFDGVKIDTLDFVFDNIKSASYATGNYLTIHYKYQNERNEILLIIECKSTIVTAVLSTQNDVELKLYLPSFVELAETMQISGNTIIVED